MPSWTYGELALPAVARKAEFFGWRLERDIQAAADGGNPIFDWFGHPKIRLRNTCVPQRSGRKAKSPVTCTGLND